MSSDAGKSWDSQPSPNLFTKNNIFEKKSGERSNAHYCITSCHKMYTLFLSDSKQKRGWATYYLDNV